MTLGKFIWSLFYCLGWPGIVIVWILLMSLTTGLISIGLIAHYIFYNRDNVPDLQSFVNFDVPQIGVIYDAREKPIINLAREYRLIIRPSEITVPVRNAFLSAEDKDFYQHNGVDWDALLLRAVGRNSNSSLRTLIQKGEITIIVQQGASTITDQIVGLYYRNHINYTVNKTESSSWSLLPRRYLIKLEELRLAIWLEAELAKPQYFGSKLRTKDEILARFLSYTYFRKVYGIKAASLYYFKKEVSQLNHGEAALLAGIVKNPSRYAPTSDFSENLNRISRRNEILDLMVKNNYLSSNESEKFKQENPPLPEDKRGFTDAPSVVGNILQELSLTGVNTDNLFDGRVKIFSTSDLEIQKITNDALEEGLRLFEGRHLEGKDIIQGSVIVLRNSDAAILAEVGGRKNYKSKGLVYSDLDRARHSLRQPGSAFKPFVFFAAITHFWTLEDTIPDIPLFLYMGPNRPRHIIHNYDGKYKGSVTLRRALFESRNAATVGLTLQVGGIKDIISIAKVLGIKTELQPYVTTAIGASEVNLLELANAYRAMASGMLAEPYIIRKVTGNANEVIFEANLQTIVAPFYEAHLELIQEGLRGTVRIPGGTAYSLTLENFPVPVMGKTGTTNDFRDALFVGSTYGPTGITVAVRIGYDDNRKLGGSETGAKAALPVFKTIVREIYGRNLVEPAANFPDQIEKSIDAYIQNPQ